MTAFAPVSLPTALVLLPLLGSLACVMMPSKYTKEVALLFALAVFALSMTAYGLYDASDVGLLLNTSDTGLFSLDGLNLWFVLLTAFLTPITLVASWQNVGKHLKAFMAAQLMIEGLLLAVFLVTDLLAFYVAFEAVLVPLFVTVGVWGGSATRVRSAFLLFLYTFAGSLFMLIALVVVYVSTGSSAYNLLGTLDLDTQTLVWLGVFIAIAAKTPLMPLHIWLPRAHADAPLAASIVLAGTVLKMATYGYLRLCLQLMPSLSLYYAPMVQALAVVSLVYASIATVRQSDMKALIAYSSIGHIAVVVVGLFSNTALGIVGAVMLGLAHGVVSPALFVLTGGVLYDRYHTRCYYYYRGLATYIPVWSALFFFALSANMGVPLTLNWLGEFMVLGGTFPRAPLITVLTSLGIVLSAAYSMWLYVRLVGGSYSPYLSYATDVTRREYIVLAYLLVPAMAFGVYSEPVALSLSASVASLASL